MKAQELSNALLACAGIADSGRAEQLRLFAQLFSVGKSETVGARLNRLPYSLEIPPRLKDTLVAIQSCLSSFGARKAAADVGAALDKFHASPSASLDVMISQVKLALEAPPARPARRRTTPAPQPDALLAKQFTDELAGAAHNTEAFKKIVSRLKDSRQVSTPTLAAIGNRFLGNSKSYKGRKDIIADILKRQGEDLLDHSRRAALKRVG